MKKDVITTNQISVCCASDYIRHRLIGNSLQRVIVTLLFLCTMLVPNDSYAQQYLPAPTIEELDDPDIRVNDPTDPFVWTIFYNENETNPTYFTFFRFSYWADIVGGALYQYFEKDAQGSYIRPLYQRMYVKPYHIRYMALRDGWNMEQWAEVIDGQNTYYDITEAHNYHTEGYLIFDIFTTFNDKNYRATIKLLVRPTTRSDGRSENTLIPQDKTISVGALFDPKAISANESDGAITYSGPYSDKACTNLSSAYTTNSQGNKVSTTTGTYYFKATQAQTSRYAEASTVVTVNVTNLIPNILKADDIVTTVGTKVPVEVTTNIGTGSYRNEIGIDLTLYSDPACTQKVTTGWSRDQQPSQTLTTSNTQIWNYTFSTSGVYYMKAEQPNNTSAGISGGTTIFKITVQKQESPLTTKANVNSIIYRSLPDALDIRTLFTTTADDGGTISYTLYDNTGTPVALSNYVLPDDLPKGTYTIVASQASTAIYESKYIDITMKIVGVYEKNVRYKEAYGTGTYSFDTHELTDELGVTTPVHVYSARKDVMTIDGITIDATESYTGNYKSFSKDGLTLKMPNTALYEYYTDYPTYTIVHDNRSDALKAESAKIKTDFVVEYDRSNGNEYVAKGVFNNNGKFDVLRYTINISPYNASGFWPVPNGFNQAGGTDIPDDVETCPLTLGGNDTYGYTAGTNDDIDYAPGKTNVFSYYTKGTTPANGNETTIPTSGTYYKFTPEDGNYLLTVGIKLDKRCKFWLLDVDGSSITSRTELGSGLETWNGVNGTVSLFTQAGHEYYFFSEGTPLGIYGYHYSNNPEGYYEKHGFLVRDKNYDEE